MIRLRPYKQSDAETCAVLGEAWACKELHWKRNKDITSRFLLDKGREREYTNYIK